MLVSLASIALGAAMALVYERAALHAQVSFARKPGGWGALAFALGFLLRLSAMGLVMVLAQRWTPADLVIVAVTFVVAFLVLQGVTLYRFAAGRGPFSASGRPHGRGDPASRRRDSGCLPSSGQPC